MCLVCIEFNKGKLTFKEAKAALTEVVETLPDEHVYEAWALIHAAETKEVDESSKP